MGAHRRKQGALQCLLQVGPEVLDVLDTDRHPHQAVGDRRGLALPPAAPLERRLDAAEGRGVHPQRRGVREHVGGLGGRQHHGDDGAEAGVADLGEGAVLGQPAGQLGGVRLRTLDPQVQRAQPAQGQPRLQRAGDRADQVAAALQHVVQLLVLHHQRAHDHVAVAGEDLGDRVKDDVGAELERLLQQGCGERVVDDDRRPGLVAGLDEPLHVGDLQRRVRRRLDPQQRRVVQLGDHGVGVGDVHQHGLQPTPCLEVAELADAAEVRVPRRDHHAVLSDEVEHRRHGRETGRERQRTPALERAERLLERRPGRVRVPPVLEVAARDVRRRHLDRRVQRLVGLVRRPPRVHDDRRGGEGWGVTGHAPNVGR
jgi:hypothetical protein